MYGSYQYDWTIIVSGHVGIKTRLDPGVETLSLYQIMQHCFFLCAQRIPTPTIHKQRVLSRIITFHTSLSLIKPLR